MRSWRSSAPAPHEDDALRAPRGAGRARSRELNTDLERTPASLATRTGVDTGEVIAGGPRPAGGLATGDRERRGPTGGGGPPRRDRRGGATFDSSASGPSASVSRGCSSSRASREPVAAYRLVDRRARRARAGAPARLAARRPRARARRAARPRSSEAVAGRDRASSSRVLGRRGRREVAARRTSSRAVVGERRGGAARAAASPTARASPTGPLLESSLKPLRRSRTATRRDAARAKLAARSCPARPRRADRRAARRCDRARRALAPGRRRSFWAVRRLLESLARERPVLLVLDDLHWAELDLPRPDPAPRSSSAAAPRSSSSAPPGPS